MENINKNADEKNIKTKKETDNVQEGEKKKLSLATLIVPIVIVVILAAFAGVIYYAQVIKPANELKKEIGYEVEDYLKLGDYTGFEYEITQEQWDECVNEENQSYDEVNREAKDKDQIDFNYTGYVSNKKDSNISQKQAELYIGEDESGIYKTFSDAIKGHKAGEKLKVTVEGSEATELSMDESDYTGKEITFELKINTVSELVIEDVTDEWVSEYYFEDYGLKTVQDFYDWNKEYILDEEVKPAIWQMAVDAANMKKYPQELYDDIVAEFEADAEYKAEEWGLTKDEYLYDFCQYTEESLEEEYLNGVKSELVMWAIVKEQGFEVSEAEILQKYEDTYADVGCDTVEEMKELYTTEEMKEAVLLDKVQNYVYDNSIIKESYKIK